MTAPLTRLDVLRADRADAHATVARLREAPATMVPGEMVSSDHVRAAIDAAVPTGPRRGRPPAVRVEP